MSVELAQTVTDWMQAADKATVVAILTTSGPVFLSNFCLLIALGAKGVAQAAFDVIAVGQALKLPRREMAP